MGHTNDEIFVWRASLSQTLGCLTGAFEYALRRDGLSRPKDDIIANPSREVGTKRLFKAVLKGYAGPTAPTFRHPRHRISKRPNFNNKNVPGDTNKL